MDFQLADDFSLQFVQNLLSVFTQQDALLCVDNAELNIAPALDGGVELGTGNQIDPLFHSGIGLDAQVTTGGGSGDEAFHQNPFSVGLVIIESVDNLGNGSQLFSGTAFLGEAHEAVHNAPMEALVLPSFAGIRADS